MNLVEHHGKRLLSGAGIVIPRGSVVASPAAAEAAAAGIGSPVVLKSQVPAGKRRKSGGIAFTDSPTQARQVAQRMLGTTLNGHVVSELLVEERVNIAAELYVAVLDDAQSKGPLVLFSASGGTDIEQISAISPERVRRHAVDIRSGLAAQDISAVLDGTSVADPIREQVAHMIAALYELYRDLDASLVEVNPVAVTSSGAVIALDCKVSLDPAALPRHPDLATIAAAPTGTMLEQQAREAGLHFIELDGDIGILANGAGLTMTTLDVVSHYGGRAANFLEIGGDAYTKAAPALRLVLSNPQVRSLLVNFCGAFARTDVMTEGVVTAMEDLRPKVPVFFTIHGTGECEAIQLVTERLGIQPYDAMDDAVKAAVAAAAEMA